MSQEEMNELARLRAENEALKQAAAKKQATTGAIKVSEKGAVSVYGLGRFPVTLYASQWEALLGRAPEIRDFIVKNTALLTTKAEKAKAVETPA